jgi:hypothetical protein
MFEGIDRGRVFFLDVPFDLDVAEKSVQKWQDS